jgi:SPP1 family predicted phage head-tail adaptor
MRAGELRDRVTLERFATVEDPRWGPKPSWTVVGDIWAKVEPLSAGERPVNNGVQSEISHRVTIRYRDDVTSKERLTYRGRLLDIVGVLDVDGRKRELLIEAKERPEEGAS